MTRFNLATPGREVAYRTRPGWLESRFALFERYCHPSIAAQTQQDFQWLIYFDDQTPDWARRRVEELQRIRPFHACYTPMFDGSGWVRTLRELIGGPVPGRIVITANLDNDDALARDYIARVQAAAARVPEPRYAVNLPDGFVLSGRQLFGHRHLQNAFTNMVEQDSESIGTTMAIRHMELLETVPVVQAEGPGGWLQVVHDGNVSNRIRGRRVGQAEALDRFPDAGIGPIDDPAPWQRLVEFLALGPMRALRDRAFKLARKIIPVDR